MNIANIKSLPTVINRPINFKSHKVADFDKNSGEIDLSKNPSNIYARAQIILNGIEPIQIVKYDQDHFLGCLIGGAIGDAYGAKIEPWKYEDIKKTYGNDGLRRLLTNNGVAEFTDDTQMSLFTAYALIKTRLLNEGNIPSESLMKQLEEAYRDWLVTQSSDFTDNKQNNILLGDERLYTRKFPGVTCLNALAKEQLGTIERPINNSAGSGGIMRCAPIGLTSYDNPEKAFHLGMQSAALTHGNPKAYIPAGGLSFLIAKLISGESLETAITSMIEKIKNYSNDGIEIAKLLEKAVALAQNQTDDYTAIQQLGKGFVGDEALAIAIYSTLKHKDNFEDALISAVNHDGDSDTVGAITGNILGAYIGNEKIPKRLSHKIQMQDTLDIIARDLLSSIDQIKSSEEKYDCKAVTATAESRREDDNFNRSSMDFVIENIDLEKMKKMTLKEAKEYKKYLMLHQKFKLPTNSKQNL